MAVNSTVKRLNRHVSPLVLSEQACLWRITGVLGENATPLFHILCNELTW